MKEFAHMIITNPAGWDAQGRTKIFLMAVGSSAFSCADHGSIVVNASHRRKQKSSDAALRDVCKRSLRSIFGLVSESELLVLEDLITEFGLSKGLTLEIKLIIVHHDVAKSPGSSLHHRLPLSMWLHN